MVKSVVLAGLCFGVPNCLLAQNQQSGTENQPSIPHQAGSMMNQEISAQEPTDANRATKIIGMNVLNQGNQKLGTVRDLVVDPKTQRVAYAWVEKSSETANTGEYVAVPINLFTPTKNMKSLVLNADKARFDSAKGYEKNQMPNMSITPNQMAFWQSITEAAGAQPEQQENK